MRASDFFRMPPLDTVTEEGEKRTFIPRNSIEEWNNLWQKFLTPLSHIETSINTEIQIELTRRDLEFRGIIKEERVEKKIYPHTLTDTLKPSLLSKASKRLTEVYNTLNQLEKEENIRRSIIKDLRNKEYIRRKGSVLYVHIFKDTFLPLSTLSEGLPISYIECSLFFKGVEYNGYITEEEILPYFIDSTTNTTDLSTAISNLRDRATSTEILGEYVYLSNYATVKRTSFLPSSQSKYTIYIICSLKSGVSFSKCIEELLSSC